MEVSLYLIVKRLPRMGMKGVSGFCGTNAQVSADDILTAVGVSQISMLV